MVDGRKGWVEGRKGDVLVGGRAMGGRKGDAWGNSCQQQSCFMMEVTQCTCRHIEIWNGTATPLPPNTTLLHSHFYDLGINPL